MTVFTPKFGMGASLTRLEDRAFITGKGRYTDDIAVPGMLHGFVLRSPAAKATFRIVSTEAAKAAPGVHLVLTGADVAHLGALKSTAMEKQPDGTKAPTRDIPILCADRVQYVGDAVAFVVADTPRAGAGRRRTDRDRLRQRGCRRQDRDRARSGNAAGLAGTRHQPRLPLSSRRQGRLGCRVRQGRACHAHRVPQQPPGLQLHGAALGHRRGRRRERPPGADHRLAGRAFHAQHPGQAGLRLRQEEAARRDARCRRRLRPESLHLPRACAGAGGSAAPRPAGEVGGRPHRAFPDRRAGPRQCHRRGDGDGQGRPLSRAEGRHDRQHGRLLLAIRAVHPAYGRHHVDRRLRHPGARRDDFGRLHQHLPGRRLSRRRPSGSGVPGREAGRRLRPRAGHRPARRSGGATSSGPSSSPTTRRPAACTTSANSTAT